MNLSAIFRRSSFALVDLAKTSQSMISRVLLLTSVALTLTSCAQGNRDVENYGDLNQSPGGIRLTDPNEHIGGWGRKDCLLCHNAALNIHRGAGSVLDADALNTAIRNNGESQYCLTCHGPNGVQ